MLQLQSRDLGFSTSTTSFRNATDFDGLPNQQQWPFTYRLACRSLLAVAGLGNYLYLVSGFVWKCVAFQAFNSILSVLEPPKVYPKLPEITNLFDLVLMIVQIALFSCGHAIEKSYSLATKFNHLIMLVLAMYVIH